MERGIVLAIAIPIVWIGVYPNPVLRRVEPAVLEILYQMDRRAGWEEDLEVDAPTKLVLRSPRAALPRVVPAVDSDLSRPGPLP